MISRRSFLLGIGSLVTSSFIARARAHVRESGGPLLLPPKRAEETLYLYEDFDLSDRPCANEVPGQPWPGSVARSAAPDLEGASDVTRLQVRDAGGP